MMKINNVLEVNNLDYPLEIIYKSSDFLVSNKPPYIRIDGDFPVTIKKLILTQHQDMFTSSKHKVHFPHQLDYATSGIQILTFTKSSTDKITRCFREKTAKKEYLALLHGHIAKDTIIIDQAILEDSEDPRGFRMKIDKLHGKPSKTRMTVLKRGYYRGFKVTKCLLEAITGRRHQLRLHCEFIGHPIVGDMNYLGNNEDILAIENEMDPPRMFLHAWKLTLPISSPTTLKKTIGGISDNKIIDSSIVNIQENVMTFQTNDPIIDPDDQNLLINKNK